MAVSLLTFNFLEYDDKDNSSFGFSGDRVPNGDGSFTFIDWTLGRADYKNDQMINLSAVEYYWEDGEGVGSPKMYNSIKTESGIPAWDNTMNYEQNDSILASLTGETKTVRYTALKTSLDSFPEDNPLDWELTELKQIKFQVPNEIVRMDLKGVKTNEVLDLTIFPNLKEVNISDSSFVNIFIPTTLIKLTLNNSTGLIDTVHPNNLEVITIENPVADIAFDWSYFENLKYLTFNNIPNGKDLNLSNFPSLLSLTVNNSGLESFPDLSLSTLIKSIDVSDNSIYGLFPGPSEIGGTVLETINLKGNPFTGEIPDLDTFTGLTNYNYSGPDILNKINIWETDKNWDYINLEWDALPGVSEIYSLKQDNNIIYQGSNSDFNTTGLSQGTTYTFDIQNDYFGTIIYGTTDIITDACEPPNVGELAMSSTNIECDRFTVNWSNDWKEIPNRSDLNVSLSMYDNVGTLIQGPIDVINLTNYTFINLFSNVYYNPRMTITKCGETVNYNINVTTLNCPPPSEQELNLRQYY